MVGSVNSSVKGVEPQVYSEFNSFMDSSIGGLFAQCDQWAPVPHDAVETEVDGIDGNSLNFYSQVQRSTSHKFLYFLVVNL